MSIVMWIPPLILVACFVGLAFCALMMWRNRRVYAYRMALADEVSIESRRAIARGDADWERGWDWLKRQPDYETMMWRFWRSLDSFLDWDSPGAPKRPTV